MTEFTAAQKKAFTACRKKIQKVFEKYQAQGLVTYIGHKKTCFSPATFPYTYVYFEAKAITGQTITNFGVNFSMTNGVTYKWGLMRILLDADDPEVKKYETKIQKAFKDREKWTEVMNNILNDIKKETVFERFIYKKAAEEA